MSDVRHCPALLVSAPASGQGKTSVTAALARWHRRQGRRVAVFKAGPDFLDPLVLARACGGDVHSIDLWMTGEADARARLHAAAGSSDLILVEGMMGLFDGTPSSADIAARFGLPVLAVIDGSAMAQSFGAVALGLARYRDDVRLHGVAANRIGGAHHARLLHESLPAGIAWMGALASDVGLALPERHLGLAAPQDVADLDARLDALADAWGLHASTQLPPPLAFAPVPPVHVPPALWGRRIAIARDAAFCFLYPANLELLRAAGAELAFFSPVAGDALPPCDAVWLPGGYPELHLPALAGNDGLRAQLRVHVESGRPLLAECGGLLYALDSLRVHDGPAHPMLGLLPGRAVVGPRLVALGAQQVALPEGVLRGHTFHFGRAEVEREPLLVATNPEGGPSTEAVYRRDRLTASFVHLYFPSCTEAALALFGG